MIFSQFRRRFPAPRARRSRSGRRSQIEGLEERALLSLTAINFGATVASPPVAVGGKLFFAATDGVNGTQLWETDGTSTVRLTAAIPALGGLKPTSLTAVGDTLFFAAN